MVHALEEAWRVLPPQGLLINLVPAAAHSRIGLCLDDVFAPVGPAPSCLDGYRAARRVLKEVQQRGLFQMGNATLFTLSVYFRSRKQLREWMIDPDVRDSDARSDRLVRQVSLTMRRHDPPGRITAVQRVTLQVLRKIDRTG